ncbi:MAG TPA: COX15/CtaA family protein, partial [Balneolaceae bacterium]|nr:COX15/CtaA family protein [Balneolaceae bacterium]
MQGQNKYIRRWLWSGAVLIFLMTIIGGITRLTGSGLSMTDWNLIMGAIPPMNEPEWMAVFEQYKQFPQYQQLNVGMTLTEFKEIFFWEYLHRLWGRMIGIVFI